MSICSMFELRLGLVTKLSSVPLQVRGCVTSFRLTQLGSGVLVPRRTPQTMILPYASGRVYIINTDSKYLVAIHEMVQPTPHAR